jgi:hypothetical protein
MSAATTTTTKPVRFAALVRVSTEAQEKQGESLATQRKQILRDVERLGGRSSPGMAVRSMRPPDTRRGK